MTKARTLADFNRWDSLTFYVYTDIQ